jgi:alpha-galactosidase
VGNVNPAWGGQVWVLDTTRPDVRTHLEQLTRTLVAMGWRYLKLDFTYAPSLDGEWHDPTLTPAQRVRQAYDAMRRGAGDDAFILGCGAPLGPCIGVVDGMRIGPDVAPHWEPRGGIPGYEDTAPATANALRNTLARDFMHRRLWLNDPDCLMLRVQHTQLTPAEMQTWAYAVANSGGMAVVSDDLGLLTEESRRLLDDVLTIGRQADRASVDPLR